MAEWSELDQAKNGQTASRTDARQMACVEHLDPEQRPVLNTVRRRRPKPMVDGLKKGERRAFI